MHRIIPLFCILFVLALAVGSCSSDESSNRPPASSSAIIHVTYEDARVVEVDAARQRALLLHNRESSSGTAIELVDLESRSVISSRILDYFDVYDIKFINASEGCFAGRPHGNIGYSVQFFSLPDLTLGTRVMTADTLGEPGSLAVDSTGGYVYYSHAGGGDKDAIYKIRVSNKLIVDADNDGLPPFSFDNDLVAGLFDHPGQVFYDRASQKLVVADLGANDVTILNAGLWGTLDRAANLAFPITGTSHLSTEGGSVSDPRATTLAYGDGVYVFAGVSDGQSYIGRFGVSSNGIDQLNVFPGRNWLLARANIRVHPREDVFSVFVLERDSDGVAVGEYRMNNLIEVAASPYRTHQVPDSAITTFGLDVEADHLIVADGEDPRLEILNIQ
jgi:hypothetical protein